MKKNRNGRRATKSLARNQARHTCCVAAYYDPADPGQTIALFTVAVVDLSTDRLVECLKFDPDTCDLGTVVEEAGSLADKYDAIFHVLTEAVPLAPCGCGCGEYTVRAVTRADLARCG